ncbi:hypothetical protein C8Q80DRAFT_1219860 [Daedaleopsis nitida]|nr:hypothetical protein C8Q80DRAFT_1219860 [Daedaleopsis nitida]
MSIFELELVHGWCMDTISNSKKWSNFIKKWNTKPQLECEAHICEYVTFLSDTLRTTTKIPAKPSTEVVPGTTYLKPLNVVHPFYYPDLLRCPNCMAKTSDVLTNRWNPKGHHEVHGVMQEETAIGVQICCNLCRKKFSKNSLNREEGSSYCSMMTSQGFWVKSEQWEIPCE